MVINGDPRNESETHTVSRCARLSLASPQLVAQQTPKMLGMDRRWEDMILRKELGLLLRGLEVERRGGRRGSKRKGERTAWRKASDDNQEAHALALVKRESFETAIREEVREWMTTVGLGRPVRWESEGESSRARSTLRWRAGAGPVACESCRPASPTEYCCWKENAVAS